MEWKDEALILGLRRHGEASVIVEAMTRGHGRHLGLVRGGRSAQMRSVLQAGNSVHVTWRARLDEHLGNYAVEADTLRAANLMQSGLGLYGLQTLATHLRLLPERDPHVALYEAALVILAHLDEPFKAARLMIRFELALLDELGFGLDLSRCAVTGGREGLIYVSPKSGRAVSQAGAGDWADRLLPLPRAMLGQGDAPDEEIAQGFETTGFFLRHKLAGDLVHKPLPEARQRFVDLFTRRTGRG